MRGTRFLAGTAALLAFVAASSALATAAERRPPNVILVLMDDMGWRDVGFVGNTFVETPNLDALAKRGVVFTQAYASAPNCAPTRACLMSGQYTPRHGIRVPLVVVGPSVAKPGSTSDVPVASIDLYPTLLELSGAVERRP